MLGGSAIFAGSFDAGKSGSVTIQATGEVNLSGGGSILTPAIASGDGGDISISARSITLTGGATLSSSADSTGNAGNITLNASSISLDNLGGSDPGIGITAGSLSSTAGGHGGHVDITADSLSLTEGAVIDVSTGGLGDAGSVAIHGGVITLDSGASTAFTGIDARSFNSTLSRGGSAGSVSLAGTSLQILGGSAVTTDSASNAPVGSLNVNVSDLTIDGRGVFPSAIDATGLLARSTGSSGLATGGLLTVQANRITLLGGGQISTESLGGGPGGTLTLTASQSIMLDGQNADPFTGIFADAAGGGGSAERWENSDFCREYDCLRRRGSQRQHVWQRRQRCGVHYNLRLAAP